MDEEVTFGIGMTIDCVDPGAQAQFWKLALGYVDSPPPQGWDSWEAWLTDQNVPRGEWNDGAAIHDPEGGHLAISLLKVPEPKQAKNRLHLDLKVSGGRHVDAAERSRRIEAKVTELVTAGASAHARHEAQGSIDHVVLLDPEGNEFCVV